MNMDVTMAQLIRLTAENWTARTGEHFTTIVLDGRVTLAELHNYGSVADVHRRAHLMAAAPELRRMLVALYTVAVGAYSCPEWLRWHRTPDTDAIMDCAGEMLFDLVTKSGAGEVPGVAGLDVQNPQV